MQALTQGHESKAILNSTYRSLQRFKVSEWTNRMKMISYAKEDASDYEHLECCAPEPMYLSGDMIFILGDRHREEGGVEGGNGSLIKDL